MTPKEKFTGKKPNVSHLRMFGYIAYVHVPNEKDQNWIQKLKNVFLLNIP